MKPTTDPKPVSAIDLQKDISRLPVALVNPKASKVFISSPYTLGDICVNVRVQHDLFDELIKKGFNPLMPLSCHYQHMIHPLSYDTWLSYTLAWLPTCDYVLRVPGESSGADDEVELARNLDIPVAFNVTELEYMWAAHNADQPCEK